MTVRAHAGRRRAVSLVEMAVVMAIIAVVISSAALCLERMYRMDRRARAAMLERSAVARLSLRFRSDAHTAVGARRVEPDQGETAALVFSAADGGQVRYGYHRPNVVRTVWRNGKVVHRDGFRLAPTSRVRWHVTDGPVTMASIILVHGSESGIQGSGAWQESIEAAVGVALGPLAAVRGGENPDGEKRAE